MLGERGVSGPFFAQRRLGNFVHAGATHIRERLSSLHDEAAVQDDARRVVTWFHRVIFKPPIGDSLGLDSIKK